MIMAWTKRQIITVQTYRRMAKLPDCEYRAILAEIAGCRSSKDAGLTNFHFDRVMASIEAKLAWRVEEGFVPAPAGVKLHYWRTRLPTDGAANSRQMHKVWELWDELKPHLPEADRTDKYLAAIAGKACGYHVRDIWNLKAWQAHNLTEALKDRLHYAVAPAANHRAVIGDPHSLGSPSAGSASSVPSVPSVPSIPQSQIRNPQSAPAPACMGAGSCMASPDFSLPF